MSDWKLPWSGSRLCGRARLGVSAAPEMIMACHCRGCQKLTSGPYSLSIMAPAQAFQAQGVTGFGGLRRDESVHHFCARCKSWLYTSGLAGGQFVNFRPTMVDEARWIVPYVESYVSEKLPGVVSGAKHSFEKFPDPQQYPELMAGFAHEGAKPA